MLGAERHFQPQQNTRGTDEDRPGQGSRKGRQGTFIRSEDADLTEIDPFTSKAAELQLHHLEHNRQVMENIPGRAG